MTDKDLNLVKIYQKMSIFHLSLMYLVVGLLSIPFAAIYACLSILTDLRKAFLLPTPISTMKGKNVKQAPGSKSER